MLGYFDAIAVPDGWFSPMLQAVGWFDDDLLAIAEDEEPAPGGTRPVAPSVLTVRALTPRSVQPRSI